MFETLDGEVARPIQPAAAVIPAPFVTAPQLSKEELQSLTFTDPSLAGVGLERAAAMSAWFCRVLDAKAAQNVAVAPQQANMLPGRGLNSGSSMVLADGLAAAGGPPGKGTVQQDDEDMSEVSASEAEQEARRMNGETIKTKIKMKKGDARKVRGRRSKKAA